MRKLAWGLLLLLLACAPARAQAVCNKSIGFTAVGTANVVITGVSGQSISVCGWHMTNTAATGTYAITTGTGPTCAAPTNNITPVLSITSTAPVTVYGSGGLFGVPAGLGVCVNATTLTVSGVLWYKQN